MEKRLSEMNPRERGSITRVTGKENRRIMEMGIIRGTEIEVVRVAPLGDPVEFLLKDYNLTLRRDEAKNVYVEVEH
ncbi:MAG: FeoA family protein [Halobacteriota archaeon]|nr:FeoA family protein [Halobacteriota archaeon]